MARRQRQHPSTNANDPDLASLAALHPGVASGASAIGSSATANATGVIGVTAQPFHLGHGVQTVSGDTTHVLVTNDTFTDLCDALVLVLRHFGIEGLDPHDDLGSALRDPRVRTALLTVARTRSTNR